MQLIIDDESNAWNYGKETCLNGCKVFTTMITELYK